MEDDEIENWYDEEKEKLTEKYKILIEKSKNKEKTEKEFKKELDELHKKYEYIMNKNIKKNLKWFFFNYNLSKIKNKIFNPFSNIINNIIESLKKDKK
ncbi:MAG: hypothetical protein QW757_01865 [Candidatus Woesearchaeota archaeon]